MALTQVTTSGIKDDAVTAAKIPADAIGQSELADDAVAHNHIADNAVLGAAISDDQIDSEHYVDGSIDHAHLANGIVDNDNIATNAAIAHSKLANVTDGQILVGNGSNVPTAVAVSGDVTLANTGAVTIATGAVEHAMLAADCVDGDNIQDDVINSEHYAAGSIDSEHIANDQIDSQHYAADSIDTEHYAPNSVDLAAMAGVARGKLIVGDSNGDPSYLAAGSNDQVLTMDANGDVGWETAGGGLDGVTTGSGNVTITDGNLIVASGHGIDFSATGDGSGTDSSELLDDYEEGTWTPYFHLGSSPGAVTNSSLYQYQHGKYTKVGRLVVAVYSLQGNPQNSNFDQWSSGDGFIKGFPYDFAGAQPQSYAFNTVHSPANQWGTTYAPYVTYENYSDKAHMGGYNSGGVEPPGNFGNHMRWTGTLTYAI